MYHGIEPLGRKGHPYYETSTSPAMFALQMKFLSDNGYTVVDLEEALCTMALEQTDRKCIVLTFDDGYRNFYSHAFPILTDYTFRSTLFLVSGLVRDQRLNRDGHEYLTWNEVRELHENGVRIGSRTVTHPTFQGASEAEIEYEIGHSKQAIEDRLGEAVRSFSYPSAFPEPNQKFTFRLRELLHTHGYVCGVSTIIGTATPRHDWFFLPRIPVNGHDDIFLFQAKLEGAYDWVHMPQKLYKTFRRAI
jgi:peptidoglycan/xylan/chitin deacetylase (PgdA/CDA1 family)